MNPPIKATTDAMWIHRTHTPSTARKVRSIIRVYDYDPRNPAGWRAAVQLLDLRRPDERRGRRDRSRGRNRAHHRDSRETPAARKSDHRHARPYRSHRRRAEAEGP